MARPHFWLNHTRNAGTITGFYNTATASRGSLWIKSTRGRHLMHVTQLTLGLGSPQVRLQVYYAPLSAINASTAYGYLFRGKGNITARADGVYVVSSSVNLYRTWIHEYFGPYFRVVVSMPNVAPGKRFGTNTFHWETQ